MIARLVHAWRSPSAFADDPSGYAANQLGHLFCVGWAPVAVFGPGAIAVTLPLYALWEWSQWRWARAEAWDCLEDGAHVLGGALGAIWPPVLALNALHLAAGYARRGTAVDPLSPAVARSCNDLSTPVRQDRDAEGGGTA